MRTKAMIDDDLQAVQALFQPCHSAARKHLDAIVGTSQRKNGQMVIITTPNGNGSNIERMYRAEKPEVCGAFYAGPLGQPFVPIDK